MDRIREILRVVAKPSLEVAVVNYARQTVVSGLPADLDVLRDVLAPRGIGLTMLKSRHPFHSSLLQPAVEPFRLMLCSYAFQSPAIPVYLCTDGTLLSSDTDLAVTLSQQFVKTMNFAGILADLHGAGYRRFVECGAGTIVTKITLESGLEGVVARATVPPASTVSAGCQAILREFGANTAAVEPPTAKLTQLAGEMQAMLERVNRALAEATADKLPPYLNGSPPVPIRVAAEDETAAEIEPCDADPIAIVSMGCVLPGAHNPEQYWNNILHGVSGITDLGLDDPAAARDFLAGADGPEPKIVSDKTYTLLSGTAGAISYDARLLAASYAAEEFEKLTRAEKLLAIAAAQALEGFRPELASLTACRVECVLGGTADGSGEYDYAEFARSIEETIDKVVPNPALRAEFSSSLRRVWGEPPAGRNRASQQESCRTVIEASAGRPIRTYIIDAACASSLYAIGLGVTALQNHTKDVMLVGGVFAPAPANSALFAQFRGLSPHGSRPLDRAADGVIFGEGAGLLVLKRLADAIESGNRVLGVIRGVGISSDGKSPAINVPQSRGQSIAIRRAYESSHIDPNSIQYVEAHATATPVGDAVEFGALRQAISRDPALAPIELGSVKALIGHTGWAAGAASVIKLCRAFEARTFPPQYCYESPNPEIELKGSPFQISTHASPWPANINSLPRRAAINGFGFGGTNAHLLIEEFHPAYHRKLCASVAPRASQPTTFAVIDAATLFPAETGLDSVRPTTRPAFHRSALRLPKGKMLLPDVTEHMDPGQYLALLSAERVLGTLGDRMKQLRGATGVVFGVESKIERGLQANQRIFLDRLRRRFAETGTPPGMDRLCDQLCAAIRKDVMPSGPYTLPGLMPNVISGRVANMFDLNGPNVVIDMGPNSLFQSVLVAADFLANRDCKMVLAGGLNAVRTSPRDAEGVFLMALTTEATARDLELPVACLLKLDGASTHVSPPPSNAVNYRGAAGALECAEAIAAVKDGVRETSRAGGLAFQSVRPAAPPEKPARKREPAPVSSTYAYVQGTPIYYYTPVLTPSGLPAPSGRRMDRRILFLTDQPDRWIEIENSGALNDIAYQVICPRALASAHGSVVDLSSEELAAQVLGALAPFDAIVPVKFAAGLAPDSILNSPTGDALGLVDLLFAVCHRYYEALQAGKISVGSLCLGGLNGGRLDAYSGLLAGFVKSLARELPEAVCRSLNFSRNDFAQALGLLHAELSVPGQPVEVCYRGDERFVMELARMKQVADGAGPFLDKNSVVLATGGGRGVTAVLAEELLTRFGCTVIAVGRTGADAAPAEILAMDAVKLAAFEPEFYRRELAKGGRKITQLRDQFRSYQAVHEVHEIRQRLSRLPGHFEYISADITDPNAMTAIVDSVFSRHGRVDLVLHGAGIQISKSLPKKSIADFQNVVRAKIAGLQHIYRACEKQRAGRPIHYHLLTSAFSYMGNDGQPDYGAANEALNRLADVMGATQARGKRGARSDGWDGRASA